VVAAALVPEADVILDLDNITAQLRDRLSSFKVPRHLIVVNEDDVPMTPSLKVQRPALRELIERAIGD
jgi:acyl-CoA synthetase (AMP-forming)/AMP-acid ligase II